MFNIVLVEDEALIRKELVLTIPWDKVNCRIIGEAEDGIEGEKVIEALNPDIVVTDIRLPGQSGLDMLEKTKPDAAIIITGFNDFEPAQRAIRLGVFDYLLKPIEEDELLNTVHRLCTKLKDSRLVSLKWAFPESIPPGDPYIRDAMGIIEAHFCEDISIHSTAKQIGISESHLSHLLKQHSGYTFLEYLLYCRIRNAMQLLKNPGLLITDIYLQCGFSSGSYFSRMFKRFTGVTPREYRRGG
ncbi:MAG: hypothetical protein B6241_02190 [Spirochaetaceae bacterium 4572_59]|nr:MAG: hypothetical protein B6241_02190 [Spirochaetaceae bacterium 4572_59]